MGAQLLPQLETNCTLALQTPCLLQRCSPRQLSDSARLALQLNTQLLSTSRLAAEQLPTLSHGRSEMGQTGPATRPSTHSQAGTWGTMSRGPSRTALELPSGRTLSSMSRTTCLPTQSSLGNLK